MTPLTLGPDLYLRLAGISAILIALIHGVLGEIAVFKTTQIKPAHFKLLLRLLWQATTWDWILMGIALILTPLFHEPQSRHLIVMIAMGVYGYAGLANCLAMKFKHPGGYALFLVVILCALGL